LHGQSPVHTAGLNLAAEASVLCGSDACILRLFSVPSSLLPACWMKFRLQLCLPSSLTPCGKRSSQKGERTKHPRASSAWVRRTEKLQIFVQITDFMLERWQALQQWILTGVLGSSVFLLHLQC